MNNTNQSNPIIRHGMQDFVVLKILTQLNPMEQRMVLFLINKTIETIDGNTEFSIPVTELAQMFEITTDGLYRELPNITDKLTDLKLQFSSLRGKKCHGELNICEYAYYESPKEFDTVDIAMVRCRLTVTMQEFVHELDNNYVQYKIKYGIKFRKQLSLPIYELLKTKYDRSIFAEKHGNQKESKYIEFDLQDFKQILEIDAPTYDNISALERSVLKPTLKEINTHTDLLVHYEKIKKGKKIDTLRFYLEYKEGCSSPYDEVAEKIKEHKSKQQKSKPTQNKKPYPKNPIRVEMVPEWLKNGNEEPQEQQLSDEDLQKIEEMKKLQESILNGTNNQ